MTTALTMNTLIQRLRASAQNSVAAALASIVSCSALAGPELQWSASVDVAGDSDAGLIVAPDGLGNVYVIGGTPMFAGGEDAVVIKYDSSGAQLWMKIFGGANEYRLPVDAVVDGKGDLYIATEATVAPGSFDVEWATLKIAADDGSLVWDRRFFGSGTFGYAIPRDIAIGPMDEIVVAGWSRNDDTFGDFGVVKYDANGTQLWSDEFSSPGFQSDVAEAVAIGSDGSVAVVGVYVQSGDRVVGTVKFNAAGELQWWRTYNTSSLSGMEDRVRSVAIDGEGNIYVAADGLNNFVDSRDFVLLKYAPDGTLLWDRRVVGPTIDIYPIVLLGGDGQIYLSGSISNTDHRLAAFDAAGNLLWTRVHDGALLDQGQRRHAVIDADGYVAVLVRTVFTPGITAFTIVRYDSAGDIVDQTTINPNGLTRFPTALAADADGRLFATGWWLPNGNRDILFYSLDLVPMQVPGDITGDGAVNVADLLAVINAWGACPAPPAACAADVTGDGLVNVSDLLMVINNWS